MKNSSRFALKIARNFTRSSKGTVGSSASSSTRRLNSSHDSSRLTKASASISASPAEGLAQEHAIADPARADDEGQVAAVDHDLLDDDGARQDDVGALGLEPADLAALPAGHAFQSLADRRHVGLLQAQPVPMLAVAATGAQVDAGQRANHAAEAHDDLTAGGGRHRVVEVPADLAAQGLKLAGPRRIVAYEAMRGAHGPERKARAGDEPPRPHPAELEAGATEIRDDAVREGQAVHGGIDAEPRFVARAQDLDLDPLAATERAEQPLAVVGVSHGGGRDGNDARPA